MGNQSKQASGDIGERRLSRAFGLHRRIQDTLDGQEKERVRDLRLAMVGVIILALVLLYVVFRWLSTDTIIVS